MPTHEHSPPLPSGLVHRGEANVPAVEHVTGVVEQYFAGSGESDAARVAREQLAAKMPFEQADLFGQGGLGDM